MPPVTTVHPPGLGTSTARSRTTMPGGDEPPDRIVEVAGDVVVEVLGSDPRRRGHGLEEVGREAVDGLGDVEGLEVLVGDGEHRDDAGVDELHDRELGRVDLGPRHHDRADVEEIVDEPVERGHRVGRGFWNVAVGSSVPFTVRIARARGPSGGACRGGGAGSRCAVSRWCRRAGARARPRSPRRRRARPRRRA